MVAQTQDQQLIRAAAALRDALDEIERLKVEDARKEANIAFLSRRVNPLVILAMSVLGVAQLPWEDDAALRRIIADHLEKTYRERSDSVMGANLNAILDFVKSAQGETVPEAPVETAEESAEKLLAQDPN